MLRKIFQDISPESLCYPNQEGVRNCEIRLNRDAEPEAMNKELRADIVRVNLFWRNIRYVSRSIHYLHPIIDVY